MGFKSARVKAGKTVSEVMDHLGVSDAAIYQWEAGVYQPRTAKLVKLAAFYGCSVDDLLNGNPNPDKASIDEEVY